MEGGHLEPRARLPSRRMRSGARPRPRSQTTRVRRFFRALVHVLQCIAAFDGVAYAPTFVKRLCEKLLRAQSCNPIFASRHY